VSSSSSDLKTRIDAIEESYEYFLAYAAQGITSDRAAKSGGQLREFLGRLEKGLDGLGAQLAAEVGEGPKEPTVPWTHFVEVVTRDADAALAAVRLVAAQPGVSSQLIDNLNANIHLRALLTDLFLVDELIDG
jgi:hypothetical protein